MTSTKEVTITVPQKVVYMATITGVVPLLCDRPPDLAPGGAKLDKSPESRFSRSYYTLPSGNGSKPEFAFPAIGVKKSLIGACRHTSLTMAKMRTTIYVRYDVDGLIRMVHPEGKDLVPEMFTGYTRNQRGQLVDVVYAKFDEWEMTFPIAYLPGDIDAEGMLNLLTIAGELIGIGVRRPSASAGSEEFGRFIPVP